MPFLRYWESDSARLPVTVTRTHSVLSWYSPSGVRVRKLLATLKRSSGDPFAEYRMLGSLPRLPIRIAFSITSSSSRPPPAVVAPLGIDQEIVPGVVTLLCGGTQQLTPSVIAALRGDQQLVPGPVGRRAD